MAPADGLDAEEAAGPPSAGGTAAAGHHLSLDDVEPVEIHIRDLSITVDTSPSLLEPSTYPELFKDALRSKGSGAAPARTKTLIHSVSASLPPGTVTAILGGSGSGKTTLLNTVAERITSPRLSQNGSVTFNGIQGVQTVRHAYVMQQDVLLPTLTVRETLRYSADLRLPPDTPAADRARVVEEVILELGLKECADTRIGDSQHRGCSGGEKRRVSIGVQMLANPSVLFLDEPTTGLDATSAFQLVRTLRSLADKGRTIVTTIHQPRSEIWHLFDNLVIFSQGSPVYSGSREDCLPWFAGLGFELPPFVNPAEFVIDISALDNRTPELESESSARIEGLKTSWSNAPDKLKSTMLDGEKVAGASPEQSKRSHIIVRKHATRLRQLMVFTDRTFKVTYRDPMGLAAAMFEAVIMGIVVGYIFYMMPRDQSGIRSREGLMYTVAAIQGYLWLVFEVYRLSIDMPTFDREHSEGCANALPFLLSRRLARLITEDVPVPFLFCVIVYFMTGLERDASKFFIFFAIVLINQYIAVTCAMTCVTASRTFAGASLIANLVYILQSLSSGFFVQANSIPIWWRWTKYIAYIYYVMGALCGNEFEGNFYDCPFEGGASNPACFSYTGTYIMDSLGYPRDWVARPIIIMVAFVVFFCALSWIGLAFIKVEMTIARARQSSHDLSVGKEQMSARSIAEVRTIDVSLTDFSLTLHKRSPLGKTLPPKPILHPVSTNFQAGVLNVIMGPSGSGKTSLLNAMALRLVNTIATRYRHSGRMTFNGAEPSNSVVRSVCSYVCQDDDALLPSLTVRETLRFAAGLRLPSWMSKANKNRRAEEMLLKMGLKDCADILVGNELVKGISGGEKRRVSIAVQILTDPRVLLLDEPTSGLDAFTAGSIMEVLRGLANEGRTLILTIHQARSDLFSHFGNVLFLARGGSPAYAGPAAGMLPYMARMGYDCPQHTNPADFALDLITIDLQEAEREAGSREKVTRLIDAWRDEMRGESVPAVATTEAIESDTAPAESKPKSPTATAAPADHEDRDTRASLGAAEVATVSAPQPRGSLNKSRLATPAELGALVRKRASLATALPILLHRSALNLARQPDLLLARTMQVVSFGGMIALWVAPLTSDYFSIQTRVGFIQQACGLYFVGMLQNVAVYPSERDVFYRESDDGAVSAEAFLGAYTLLEAPFEVLSALLFALLLDLAVGLPRTAALYFTTAFVAFAVVSCGESLGVMFNTLFADHQGFAVSLTSIVLSVAQTMGGVMSTDMPPLLNAFNYLSPTRYAVRVFATASLRGIVFSCEEAQKGPDGNCLVATGEQVLRLYKLDVDTGVNMAALAGCVVVYRLVAWGLLRAVRTRWKEGWLEKKKK